MTPERYIVFIHRSELKKTPKVGAIVKGRVTFIREDGRINASLRPVKKDAMKEDMESILSYLEMRNGRMPLSDQSDPAIIKERFNISKAAFKRALGSLMKEDKIIQDDGWTILKEKD